MEFINQMEPWFDNQEQGKKGLIGLFMGEVMKYKRRCTYSTGHPGFKSLAQPF